MGETAGKLHGGIHRQFLQSFPPKAREVASESGAWYNAGEKHWKKEAGPPWICC